MSASPSHSATNLKENDKASYGNTMSGLACLHPGSTWIGSQTNGRKSYGVRVTILTVDVPHSKLTGYLSIRGLAQDIEELTTYFEGEILGLPTGNGLHETDALNHNHNTGVGFLTPEWATEAEDLKHWSRFPAFLPLKQNLALPHSILPEKYKYDPTKPNGKHIFMRWKEQFVVPDHTVTDICGASYEGFYYVCVTFERPPKPVRKPCRSQKSFSTIPSVTRSGSLSPPRSTVRLPQTSVISRATSFVNGANATPTSTRPPFSYAAALRRNSTSTPSTRPTSLPRIRAQSASSSTMIRPLFQYPTPPQELVPLPDVGPVYAETIVEDIDEQAQKNEEHVNTVRNEFSFSEGDFPGISSSTSVASELQGSRGRQDNISRPQTGQSQNEEVKSSTYPVDPFFDDGEETEPYTTAWKYATMNGFYYHANSEPFQEIKLSYADFWNGSRGSIIMT